MPPGHWKNEVKFTRYKCGWDNTEFTIQQILSNEPYQAHFSFNTVTEPGQLQLQVHSPRLGAVTATRCDLVTARVQPASVRAISHLSGATITARGSRSQSVTQKQFPHALKGSPSAAFSALLSSRGRRERARNWGLAPKTCVLALISSSLLYR